MKKLNLGFWALIIATSAWSQEKENTIWKNSLDGTVAVSSYQGSVSIAWVHNWGVGKKQRLRFGLGTRFTSYIGQNQYYETAPANITSGSTSPAIIFNSSNASHIDTLLVKSPQVNALNIMINFDYSLSKQLWVGFNIDAIGFSFGGGRQANYINGSTGKITEGSPTPFNVLLVSDNDHGTLNSEMYVKYFLNDKWGLKAGGQFLFTEYTTSTKVQTFPEENDRFRNKSLMVLFGITYRL